jgi:hypothetical protein
MEERESKYAALTKSYWENPDYEYDAVWPSGLSTDFYTFRPTSNTVLQANLDGWSKMKMRPNL